jgi:DNA-binding MarR family transcriptional regulator
MDTQSLQRIQLAIGLERLTGLVRNQAWRDGSDAHIHPAQRALLAALASDGESMRPSELAARLGVSAASISDSIRATEAKGWLERTADPDDARARRLSLTDAGARLIAGLQRNNSGLSQLLDALPERDSASMLRIVQLLIQRAQAMGLASGTRTCLGCAYFRPYANADTDPQRPHFCAFVDAAFGDAELRTDCAEQQPQDPMQLAKDIQTFHDGPNA